MKKNYVKKCLALTLAFSMTFSTVAFADTAKDTYTNEQGSGENGTIGPERLITMIWKATSRQAGRQETASNTISMEKMKSIREQW